MGVTYYDNLPNKPLVETFLEIKWGEPGRPDPAYPLIVGRLYEKMKDPYRAIQDLDLAQFPPALAVHVPRHRFRVGENQWPLVQIGPGIAAVNDTENYSWSDFRARALVLLVSLREVHPQGDEMPITGLKLEYIDAIEFDFEVGDVRPFLREKLRIVLALPDAVFDGQPVDDRPKHTVVQLAFPTRSPRGLIQFSVRTGAKEGRPALILNTSVASAGDDAADGWRELGTWLDGAHNIIRHWFFTLVQGQLLKEFLRS